MGQKTRKIKRGKKGLSPVVATVLLISIVIAIAVIVFLWFRGLTEEAITKFDGENVELVCRDKVDFRAQYHSSSGKLDVSNTGNTPLYNLRLKVSGPGGYETKEISDISDNWPTDKNGNVIGLGRGEARSLDVSGVVGSDADSISLIPVLVGNSEEGSKDKKSGEEPKKEKDKKDDDLSQKDIDDLIFRKS